VVFKDPGGWLDRQAPPNDGPTRAAARKVLTFIGLLPTDSGQHLIKRVIGLPGDTVVCCDANGAMTVNGVPLEEPYLRPGSISSERKFTVEVPAGRLWVMGDNRQQSRDSRFNMDNHQGTVPVANVVGRSFVVVWPFPRMQWMDRPSDVFAGVPDR
jgi:signal peptidase I